MSNLTSSSANRICIDCGTISPDGVHCFQCGRQLPVLENESSNTEANIGLNHFIFEDSKLYIWSLPLAFLLAWLVDKVEALKILSYLFTTIPLHELGHALVAWCGGRWAIPIGAIVPTAGMTLVGADRHLLLSLLVISLCGWGLYRSYNKQFYFFSALAIMGITASFYLSFIVTNKQVEVWGRYGGCAGEVVLSCLLICSFYHRFPQSWRWDFFRFPILLVGTVAFMNAFLLWDRIKQNKATLPFGAAISSSGAKDGNGDMNQLMAFGWSEHEIVRSYNQLGKWALAVIVGYYIFGLITRGLTKRS